MKQRVLLSSICLLLILLPLLATAAPPAREFSPVQKGFVASGEKVLPYAPDRILIQFTDYSMEKSKLNISLQRGSALPGGETGLSTVDAISREVGALRIYRPYIELKNKVLASELGIDRWYMVDLPMGSDVMRVVERYASDPNIEHANPDYRAFPAVVPSDPLYADHWGHNNTAQMPSYDWSTHTHTGPLVGTVGFDSNAEGAWDGSQGFGSSSVIVAILDSGVDIDHPDLQANLVSGYDFGDNDSNPNDDASGAGHGTCCAGVAASVVNNGIGACGIAPGVKIMPCKVANSAGSMYFSYIENAIYWAADNGADVISMSLGAAGYGPGDDPATDAAIVYAYNAGVVILAATGNENSSLSYPANHGNVIGVGAASNCGDRKRSSSSSSECNPGVSTDPNGYTCDGERWWGSNYGPATQDAANATDVLAPTILPTTDIAGSGGYDPGNYDGFFNGTSCSTPYAAGVCALIKSKNPTWTPAQIRSQLTSTAIDIINVESGSGWDRYSGYGMVDAEAAVGGGTPTAPTAAFTGTPTSGFAPLTVDFTDQSSGSPTSWSWVFGDGGTSSAQNPSHQYTNPGTYTVTLTVSNAYGSDDEIKTNYITVNDPGGLYADLPYSTGFETGNLDQHWTTASNNNGQIRLLTSNTPHSGSYHMVMDCTVNGTYSQNEAWLHLDLAGQGDVDLDFWWKDFSDETHTQDGVYFSDNGGASFVKVQDLPGASYTNNTWYSFNLDVDALASANGLSMSSTFVIKFQQYDNYMITTDGHAFDDISVTSSVPPPPVAEFVGSPTSGVRPLTVNFTDQSTGSPTSWSWTFGDGGTSTSQNPSHQYTAAGTYTVSLTATNAYGNDTETKTNYITVADPPPPVAAFSGTPTSGDAPLTVNFTDESTGNPTSWSWTFGDGGTSTAQNPSHQYTSAGTYTVSLTATNAYGNDTETKTDYITVTEPGSGYANLPYTTGFESGSLDQYWTTASGSNGRVRILTTNTPHSGSYHLVMDAITSGTYAQNEAWLHVNLSGQTAVDLEFWWKEFGDETHTQDGVYFSDDGGSSFVKVQDLNGGSYTNNTWYNFQLDVDQLAAVNGLNLTSTFVIKFQQYDNYVITTDGHAYDDISITAQGPQPPVADFSGDPTAGTVPLTVNFTDLSTGAPASWSWTFGDGGTSTSQNPSHQYTVAGTYTVSLTATNAYGNDTETKTDYITVSEPGSWTDITYDDFESGWGNYTDGGGDCALYTGGTYAWQGTNAADIQDNSGVASSFYHTGSYNVTSYNTLEVEFYFVAISMESGEDFWVQYYNGSTWYTVASYARDIDFSNNTWYVATVTIPRSSYTFPTNAKIRFMCDASGNYDDVYIDAITFRGTASVLSSGVTIAKQDRSDGFVPVEMNSAPEIDITGLMQNYPNPFNPSTTISFNLETASHVKLEVFNVEGRRVATLVNGKRGEGIHHVKFDASKLSSGIYIYRFMAGDVTQSKKMLLIK
jgi:PKD repeat protein